MTIKIENVIPQFLEKEKIGRSEVWSKSLNITKGERIQVVAASGSGKTSLIHFLFGLRKDYKGEISFDNKNIATFLPGDFSKLRQDILSIIFQDLRLFPAYSVLENIEVKRVLQPFTTTDDIARMANILGISNKLHSRADTCSFGERQRVAIIRALQQPFEFILMDEPFSHLDETNSRIAMQLIEAEAAKRNAGIILADLKKVDFFKADRMFNL